MASKKFGIYSGQHDYKLGESDLPSVLIKAEWQQTANDERMQESRRTRRADIFGLTGCSD